MGEIANDMINGACCSICGAYFVKDTNFPANEDRLEFDAPVMYEHDYPVACESCWTPDCGYEKQESGVQVL